jgi:hypothetical protein
VYLEGALYYQTKKKRKKPCRPKILLTLKRRGKNTTPTGLLMFRFMIILPGFTFIKAQQLRLDLAVAAFS